MHLFFLYYMLDKTTKLKLHIKRKEKNVVQKFDVFKYELLVFNN